MDPCSPLPDSEGLVDINLRSDIAASRIQAAAIVRRVRDHRCELNPTLLISNAWLRVANNE